MNNKILIGVIIVLLALLGWVFMGSGGKQAPCPEPAACPEVRTAGIATSEEAEFHPDNKAAAGKLNRRTWVVLGIDGLPSDHLVEGDAFRLKFKTNKYKIIPLTNLRGRWSMEEGSEVDLVEGPNGVLCVKVVLTGHTKDKDHLYKFQLRDDGLLGIEIEVLKSDKWDCTEIKHQHGGTAHAEN